MSRHANCAKDQSADEWKGCGFDDDDDDGDNNSPETAIQDINNAAVTKMAEMILRTMKANERRAEERFRELKGTIICRRTTDGDEDHECREGAAMKYEKATMGIMQVPLEAVVKDQQIVNHGAGHGANEAKQPVDDATNAKNKKERHEKGAKRGAILSNNWVAGNFAKELALNDDTAATARHMPLAFESVAKDEEQIAMVEEEAKEADQAAAAATNKKKKKRKKKGANRGASSSSSNNWMAGNLAKITVGSIMISSLTLLVSVSFGLGQGAIITELSPSFLLRRNPGQSVSAKVDNNMAADSRFDIPSEGRPTGPGDEAKEKEHWTSIDDLQPVHSRLLPDESRPTDITAATPGFTQKEKEIGMSIDNVQPVHSQNTPAVENRSEEDHENFRPRQQQWQRIGQESDPRCPVADNTKCGCSISKQSDYRGTIATTESGNNCTLWHDFFKTSFPNSGMNENYCRNPSPDFDEAWCAIEGPNEKGESFEVCDVPKCDACSCTPPCGTPNLEGCGCPSFFQAQECCDSDVNDGGEEDDDDRRRFECRFGYLKEACRIGLTNRKDGIKNRRDAFCDSAEAAFCEGKVNPYCGCGMYEHMCAESPDDTICELAASSCCDFDVAGWASPQCLCDFYTSTSDVLGFGSEEIVSENCLEASAYQETLPYVENKKLRDFYKDTKGENWYINTGWSDEWSPEIVNHCNWFGITCEDGFVTRINLRNNNLSGRFSLETLRFPKLMLLVLAENNLSGRFSYGAAQFYRKLVRIDVSGNEFYGHADMTFSPATLYANYSHNRFTSVGFKRFTAGYETLKVVDLSSNLIDQDVSKVFLNLPPNLEKLDLSDNAIGGELPNPFPSLENIQRLAIANNDINGRLPKFSRSIPRVQELDLSNQRRTSKGGLVGDITDDFTKLDDLLVLNLAVNRLASISSDFGNLDKLEVLNVSSNLLGHTIPPEFGKLADVLDVLDLSDNKLKGSIPSTFQNFEDTSVHLNGNTQLYLHLAPLMLCFRPKFDLVNDSRICPLERSALKVFYESVGGEEWTDNSWWASDYTSHCDWFGVTCSDTNNTIELNLRNNGLAGTLSEEIKYLPYLEVLDLSDNDMRGTIPAAIGLLSELTHLRLAYNEFIGSMPTQLRNIPGLELIQFHGNRISGTIPTINWMNEEDSSFIADCGNPSDFEQSLECKDCTMCCNQNGDCYPQGKPAILDIVGADNYAQLTIIWTAFLFCAFGAVVLTVYAFEKYRNFNLPESTIRGSEMIRRDAKYSMSTIGDDSVYKFFLSKCWWGWTIALGTIAVQSWMLFEFVKGAEIDLSNDTSHLVYTWKCPRDDVDCEFKSDLTGQGWMVFVILMLAHLMKDIINGSKLIVLSAKERHDHHTRLRYFFGGSLLSFVTLFALFASTVYNKAIATNNTEIILNSVVILFINDIDELFYEILMITNSSWVEEIMNDAPRPADDEDFIQELKDEIDELREKLQLLEQRFDGEDVDPDEWRKSKRSSGWRNELSRALSVKNGKKGKKRRLRPLQLPNGSERSTSPLRIENGTTSISVYA